MGTEWIRQAISDVWLFCLDCLVFLSLSLSLSWGHRGRAEGYDRGGGEGGGGFTVCTCAPLLSKREIGGRDGGKRGRERGRGREGDK